MRQILNLLRPLLSSSPRNCYAPETLGARHDFGREKLTPQPPPPDERSSQNRRIECLTPRLAKSSWNRRIECLTPRCPHNLDEHPTLWVTLTTPRASYSLTLFCRDAYGEV